MEIWVGKLVTIIQTGRGCCIVHTQHNFCTQQLRYVGITILVILFWISCVLKVWTNSFQEVLEAVLVGAWSIPPTAHGWLLCGSPTRNVNDLVNCCPCSNKFRSIGCSLNCRLPLVYASIGVWFRKCKTAVTAFPVARSWCRLAST